MGQSRNAPGLGSTGEKDGYLLRSVFGLAWLPEKQYAFQPWL
ncbi:MAG TPA: hypothetical protein PLQ38_05880 [Methanothrix sp.]|nr:hypothetical protein [Methanothrix sp.]